MLHEDNLVDGFQTKSQIFNAFLAQKTKMFWQNSLHIFIIDDNFLIDDNHLSSVSFSQGNIATIIQNLDPNKTHSHGSISICMLKICGSSIYKPLEMIFKQCNECGVFPSEWKKDNIVSIHKRGDKQTLKNYHPVSLLPICGKILERLLFKHMFKFFN